MGRNKHQQLDRLIEEVATGRRELSSIRDRVQREAVRIALRLHKEAAAEPDAYTRIRMRARVLGTLRPHGPTLRDHAWTALELIAKPAPYIVRGVAVASVLVCLGMGAIVASADTLPDDLLYPVKIGAESVRLALSDAASDRAVIELSVAEHRLREAERLAASGRTTDALVASAMYSQHIAWAAADAPDAPSDLGQQLELRFDADRARAESLASSLSTNAKSAGAARILALIAAPTTAPGDTSQQRVASTAAGVAEQLVQVAEQNASAANASAANAFAANASTAATTTAESSTTNAERRDAVTTPPAATADTSVRATDTPRSTDARPADARTPRPTDTARPETAPPTATPVVTDHPDPQKANEALQTVRKALEEAKAAADKAKARRH